MKYLINYKNQQIIVGGVEPQFPGKYRESPEKYRDAYIAKDKDGNMVCTYSRPVPSPESTMEVLVGNTERANIKWLVNTMPNVFDIYRQGLSYIQVVDQICAVNDFDLFVYTPKLTTLSTVPDGAYYVVLLDDNRVVLSPQKYSLDFNYDSIVENFISNVSVKIPPKRFWEMCNSKSEFISFIFGSPGYMVAATLPTKTLRRIRCFPVFVSGTFTYKGMKHVISENGTRASDVGGGYVTFFTENMNGLHGGTAMVQYTEFHRVAEKDLIKAERLNGVDNVLILEEGKE